MDLVEAAWDEHRPPDPELIKDCVHCGFCLPTCPSYLTFEEEMDSPRGRIVLMRVGHEDAELSDEMVTHFDRCLGCMACVTACPSGIQYDKLIEQTRPQIERHADRPLAQRAWRRGIFELFTHPGGCARWCRCWRCSRSPASTTRSASSRSRSCSRCSGSPPTCRRAPRSGSSRR